MLFRPDFLFVAIPIALTLFSAGRGWFARWSFARRRLDQMRRYEVGFGQPSENTLQSLQEGEFRRLEDEFTALGFELLGDYVIAGGTKDEVPLTDAPLASPVGGDMKQEFRFAHASVCRLLVHPQHNCLGAITAPLSSTRQEHLTGLQYLVTSAGDDWTYTSHADLPPRVELETSARDLSSYEGRIPPAELLKEHLERRDQIARAGKFAWGEAPTLEQIIEWEVQRYERIRKMAAQISPLSLMRAERIRPKRDYLGELQGHL